MKISLNKPFFLTIIYIFYQKSLIHEFELVCFFEKCSQQNFFFSFLIQKNLVLSSNDGRVILIYSQCSDYDKVKSLDTTGVWWPLVSPHLSINCYCVKLTTIKGNTILVYHNWNRITAVKKDNWRRNMPPWLALIRQHGYRNQYRHSQS